VLIDLVRVPARGVGLPQLNKRVAHRTTVLVHYAAADDNAFAQGLAVMVSRQVVIGWPDSVIAEHRTAHLRESRGIKTNGLVGARLTDDL
jgi:hypothetical protein